MPKRKAESDDEDDEASLSGGGGDSSGEEDAYKPPKKVAKTAPAAGGAPAAAAAGGRGGGAKKAAAPVRNEVDDELDAPPPPPGGGAAGGASDDDDEGEGGEAEREAEEDAEFDDRQRSLRQAEAKRMQCAPFPSRDLGLCLATRADAPRAPCLRRRILASFTPAQLERYESFRRSVLNRKAVKKLAMAATGGAGPAPTVPMLVVLAGLGKQFCGELVEEGRRVMADRGEAGPLRPVHVQEAHRRLAARGKVFCKGAGRQPLLGGRSAASRGRL